MSLARDKLELKILQLQSDANRLDDLTRFMQHQQQIQMQNFQVLMTQRQEQMNVQQQQHMQLTMKLLDRVGKQSLTIVFFFFFHNKEDITDLK